MAKSRRMQTSRKPAISKAAQKLSSRRAAASAPSTSLEPMTRSLEATLKQLRALKTTGEVHQARVILKRYLAEIEAILPAQSSARKSPGGRRDAPGAASVEWDDEDSSAGVAGDAPSMSTHGSGGGGFD
ncbi:MAG TPA: hypothetical protein VFK57_25165 [Vicinamibacterales bacterium]|nr:hypothetical protein [Vicinamibacterales bacterium]